MENIKFKLAGTAPLMMHKDTLANPLHPNTKEHKEVTGKRKKTDEDHEWLAMSEFRSGIYYDEVEGPYIPGIAIEAMLVASAKMHKLGVAFRRGVIVVDEICPIEYTGPRKLDKLVGNISFTDFRSVVLPGGKRIQRCRPIFREWKTSVTVAFNPEITNANDVTNAMYEGGELIGLLDYRPRFGRFSAEVVK